MKGWPLARALLALISLLLVGLPLTRLTAPRAVAAAPVAILPAATPAPTPPPAAVPETVTLEVTFTQPPQSFSLRSSGKELLQAGEAVSFDYRQPAEVTYLPQGMELEFDANWPEHFRKVGASVKVTRANGMSQTQTIWGRKEIHSMLKFSADSKDSPKGAP